MRIYIYYIEYFCIYAFISIYIFLTFNYPKSRQINNYYIIEGIIERSFSIIIFYLNEPSPQYSAIIYDII